LDPVNFGSVPFDNAPGETSSTLVGKVRMIVDMVADERLTDGAFRVAAALLFRFHNSLDGRCFPSQNSIANASKRKQRAAQYAVQHLVEAGWLSIQDVPGTSNCYSFPRLGEYTSAPPCSPPVQQPAPGECSVMQPTSAAPCTQTQELNTGTEHKKGTHTASAHAALPELLLVLDRQHADAVIEHCKNLGRPLTAYSAKLLAKKFTATKDPNNAADLMIERGWRSYDISWVKGQKAGGRYDPDTDPHLQGLKA
jgi:helix-turn-helix protein